MDDIWNIPDADREASERLLEIANATALTPEGLEAYAQLVNGIGAPESWRNRVRAAAAHQIRNAADRNIAPPQVIGCIGRALALVKEGQYSS